MTISVAFEGLVVRRDTSENRDPIETETEPRAVDVLLRIKDSVNVGECVRAC